MFISKKHIPRRTVLKGAGVTLALPLLDAMVPALTATARTVASPVRRLGFVYIPHGAVMSKWTPGEEGRITELSPSLKVLEGYQDQMIVPTNLEHRNAQGNGMDGNAEHTRSCRRCASETRRHAERQYFPTDALEFSLYGTWTGEHFYCGSG